MIYLGYLLILALLLIVEHKSCDFKRFARVALSIIYSLLIGLRSPTVGVDTHTYYEHYLQFGNRGCSFIEPGFDFLNQLLYSHGFGPNAFFLIFAIASCYFIYLAIDRFEGLRYTVAAVFMYTCTFTFLVNGMRQGVACAGLFFAIRFIEERRLFSYLLIIISCSLIHASAILLIPLYFVNRIRISRKLLCYLYATSFLFIFINVVKYLPAIDIGIRDYSNYIINLRHQEASSLGFIFSTVLNVIIFLWMCKSDVIRKYPHIAFATTLAFCLKNVGFNFPIMGRITIYFSWFTYLILAFLFISKTSRVTYRTKIILITIICAMQACIILNAFISPRNKLIPYNFGTHYMLNK